MAERGLVSPHRRRPPTSPSGAPGATSAPARRSSSRTRCRRCRIWVCAGPSSMTAGRPMSATGSSIRRSIPRGEADMRQLVAEHSRAGSEAAAVGGAARGAPGSDLLHDHTDMLLLDKEGAVAERLLVEQLLSLPGLREDRRLHAGAGAQVHGRVGLCGTQDRRPAPERRRALLQPGTPSCPSGGVGGEAAGLLSGDLPDRHADQSRGGHRAVPLRHVLLVLQLASINQAPASDPESSWQVRLKGKTLKALMGPSAAFAGDHVELSDGGDDFASTVGIGAIVSTKFTWPSDPKPKDSFLLTPEREALWRKWIALYNERQLPRGHLSRRTVRHRLRQARDARGREGRAALLRLLRARVGRAR